MPSQTYDAVIQCPHTNEDGDVCEGDIVVELEFTPGEMYGQDADGNRGVWHRGYLSVIGIGPCLNGCTLDVAEEREVERRAERAAEDYGRD